MDATALVKLISSMGPLGFLLFIGLPGGTLIYFMWQQAQERKREDRRLEIREKEVAALEQLNGVIARMLQEREVDNRVREAVTEITGQHRLPGGQPPSGSARAVTPLPLPSPPEGEE